MSFKEEGSWSWLTSKFIGQFINVLVKIANVSRRGRWLLITKRLTGFWPRWMKGSGRLLAGLLALRQGRGGILRVAEITGLSRTTIRRGIEELQRGIGRCPERIRQPGGGRKRLEKNSPRC